MWVRHKRIYDKPGQLPTPTWFGNELAVFYSYRVAGQSHIGRLLLDRNLKVLDDMPMILAPGATGCFDEAGVMPSFVRMESGQYVLYYTGWYLRKNVPYGHAIGVATSSDGEHFEREYDGPLLGLQKDVPFLANSPFICGNHMYFCNGQGWDGDFPYYTLWLGEMNYKHHVQVVRQVIHGGPAEAFSRPCVRRKPGSEEIWTAVRTKDTPYCIHYYKNQELVVPDVLPLPSTGWDSEMVCYPSVFQIDGRDIMLYNGNGYGASGIGFAELD